MGILLTLLFLCFILKPGVISGDKPEFLDLSKIHYKIVNLFGDHTIKFRPPGLKISCSGCGHTARKEIKCKEGGPVATKIEMKNERMKILMAYNVSCKYIKSLPQIADIKIKSGVNNLSLSWTRPSNEIKYYYIYFFNEVNQIDKHIQNSHKNSFFKSYLKEKTLYQICIATIDEIGVTGRFVCKQLLTDVSVTGPVTNAVAKSESDKIFISWATPQYKHDIPQGYVVHLKGPHNFCHTVIIKMMEVEIPDENPCLNNLTKLWSSLDTLEFKELTPYSEYQIEIIPFNLHKSSKMTSLSVKTKDGESDAVENLGFDTSSPRYLYIHFKKPSNPHGKILTYRIKINRTKIDICGRKGAFNYEIYSDKPYVTIKQLEILKQCGLYLIEVTPKNGWVKNKGLGKSVSIPYEYFTENLGTMTLNVLFLSSNMVRFDMQISRNDNQCPINGIVVSIINENNKTDCMTRIMAKDNCDELKNNVNRSHNCPNIKFGKFDNQSSGTTMIFSTVFLNKNKYKIGAYRIFYKIERITFADISLNGKIEDVLCDYDG